MFRLQLRKCRKINIRIHTVHSPKCIHIPFKRRLRKNYMFLNDIDFRNGFKDLNVVLELNSNDIYIYIYITLNMKLKC